MDLTTARWLVGPEAVEALRVADGFADLEGLAAGVAVRRVCSPERASAALTLVGLRRKARAKFGDVASSLYFTTDGLQQATRRPVAAWRADRFAAAGRGVVHDLGCGIGADAMAFAAAGLRVQAVDADPVTALFARANLAVVSPHGAHSVDCLDVSSPNFRPPGAPAVGGPPPFPGVRFQPPGGDAVFLDPARRTAAGRSWRLADLSPSWERCLELLRGRFGCLKAGPGIDRSLIPPELGAVWVSHDGDLVETCLWADSADYPPGTATALVLRGGEAFALRLVGAGAVAGATRSAATKASPPRLDAKRAARPSSATPTGGSYLYEPDPAVIRAGGIDQLAERLGATRVNPGIAYLVGPDLVQTPFAEAFAVLDAWPYSLKALRAWTRAHEVGVLEIKCRGVDVDPAQLRRQLKLRGPAQAGVVLGPTPRGATAFVVRRVFGGRMTP